MILSCGTNFVIFDICGCLETSLVSHMGMHVEGVLLASSGERPGMPLTSCHAQDSTPTTKNSLVQNGTGAAVRRP